MSDAVIFDIQKFCTHDGPGIRTTVFLKGCPLRCCWCHNPESWKPNAELMFTMGKCFSCGKCATVCGEHAHRFFDKKHVFIRNSCVVCGKCVQFCPSDALEMCGKTQSVDDVLREILKDKAFYDNSNGGLTISGGEPMSHPIFTKELLQKAKEAGIHTAMETCGYCKTEDLMSVLPFCDLFLFDIKTLNPLKHKTLTNVENTLILKNLHWLNEHHASIVLRCPLIPTQNDSDEELLAIGELAEQLENVSEVHVEPYHPLGVSKAEKLDIEGVWDAPFASGDFTARCIEMISQKTHKKVRKS